MKLVKTAKMCHFLDIENSQLTEEFTMGASRFSIV